MNGSLHILDVFLRSRMPAENELLQLCEKAFLANLEISNSKIFSSASEGPPSIVDVATTSLHENFAVILISRVFCQKMHFAAF